MANTWMRTWDARETEAEAKQIMKNLINMNVWKRKDCNKNKEQNIVKGTTDPRANFNKI